MGNSVIMPPGVIRPIWLTTTSVNPRLPSEPAAMLVGEGLPLGRAYSTIAPVRVIRPICLPICSVNHRLPSDPAVIDPGRLFAVGIGNSTRNAGVVRRGVFVADAI